MNHLKNVRITIGPWRDTKIVVDGVEQDQVAEFELKQKVGEEFPTLAMTQLIVAEHEDDIVIDGLAAVVQRFENKALEAAERQQIALQSFWIRDRGEDPTIDTLSDIVRDAKRYRAIRTYCQARLVIPNVTGLYATDGETLDKHADILRQEVGAWLARATHGGDTESGPKPSEPS